MCEGHKQTDIERDRVIFVEWVWDTQLNQYGIVVHTVQYGVDRQTDTQTELMRQWLDVVSVG